jgi:hypothetical protein
MSSTDKPGTTPFIRPDLVPTSNKTPSQNVNEEINKNNKEAIQRLKLTEGKIASLSTTEGFVPYPIINSSKYPPGRTIFIPKNVQAGVIPPSSYNNGWGTGAPCNGPHCGPSPIPTMSGMQQNMMSASMMAQFGSKQFAPTMREGNSTDTITNYNMYIHGTSTNPGPYRLKVSD